MFAVSQPYTVFTDNDGTPLSNGYVYVGGANLNPEVTPIPIYWDVDATQPAAQPLRTIEGYISRNGTAANIFVATDYSMTVKNQNGAVLLYSPTAAANQITSLQNDLANTTNPTLGAGSIGYSETTLYVANVGAALRDRAQIIDSVAELRTTSKLSTPIAYVTGYYSRGDGGAPGLVYFDAADVSSLDNGVTVFVAADGGRWKRLDTSVISTKQAGAKADNSTDDFAAITRWFSVGSGLGAKLVIDVGTHIIATGQLFDFTAVANKGLVMEGYGAQASILKYTSAATRPLQFQCSGSCFYCVFKNFQVLGAFDGPVLTVGKDSYADAFNSCRFENVNVKNTNLTANVEGVRLNYVLQSYINIIANGGGTGRPGQPTTPGFGKALVVRQVAFCNFFGSCGNANIGLYLTDGFTFGNTFTTMDIEEVSVGVHCDSANAQRNLFLSGTYLASTLFDFDAGFSNRVYLPNMSPYAGGVQLAGTTGITIQESGVGNIVTPSIPTVGNSVTNTTGRNVQALIQTIAGVSTYSVARPDGSTYTVSHGSGGAGDSTVTILLGAGDTFTHTLGSITAWVWAASP